MKEPAQIGLPVRVGSCCDKPKGLGYEIEHTRSGAATP